MANFVWNKEKNLENQQKHNVKFEDAQRAFLDPDRIIYEDISHSSVNEKRYFCIGKFDDKICTVRFTYRHQKIRIFGAGYWRKERRIYGQKQKTKQNS